MKKITFLEGQLDIPKLKICLGGLRGLSIKGKGEGGGGMMSMSKNFFLGVYFSSSELLLIFFFKLIDLIDI